MSYPDGKPGAGKLPGRYVSRTPKDLDKIQDRRAEVVKLRAQGLTWDQIAERTGFAGGSGALKAWRRAIAQAPNLAVAEIRAAEAARLEQMDSVLAGIIASPPARTTAIGKTVVDPDTGLIVRDMTAVIAAVRERRQVGESYRRLTSADAPPLAPVVSEDYSRALAVHHQLARQAPAIARLPLPAGYAELSPEQQLAAVLDRERAHRDALLAAIPQPGDSITVNAEIVE